MGFFSWITGAKSVDKTLDIIDKTSSGVISGLDKVWYTSEEKAENLVERLKLSEKMSKTHIEMIKATADENTTRSVTRRVIAISIMFLTFLSICVVSIVWRYDKEWAEFIVSLIQYYQVGWAFIAVVIFFFGNHMLTGARKK